MPVSISITGKEELSGPRDFDLVPEHLQCVLRQRDFRDAIWRLGIGNPYSGVNKAQLRFLHRKQSLLHRNPVSTMMRITLYGSRGGIRLMGSEAYSSRGFLCPFVICRNTADRKAKQPYSFFKVALRMWERIFSEELAPDLS